MHVVNNKGKIKMKRNNIITLLLCSATSIGFATDREFDRKLTHKESALTLQHTYDSEQHQAQAAVPDRATSVITPISDTQHIFDQSYVTVVLNDGNGDFHHGLQNMLCLTSKLSQIELSKTLFIFLIENVQSLNPMEYIRRIENFRAHISQMLKGAQSCNWYVGMNSGSPNMLAAEPDKSMFDLFLAKKLPIRFMPKKEPLFPSYAEQSSTPIVHLVSAVNTESAYKAYFSLRESIGKTLQKRTVVFHGEMGSLVGLGGTHPANMLGLLQRQLTTLIENEIILNTLKMYDALEAQDHTATSDDACTPMLRLVSLLPQVLSAKSTQELLHIISTFPEFSGKIDSFLQDIYHVFDVLQPCQLCGLGFGPKVNSCVILSESTTTIAPGHGIFLNKQRHLPFQNAREHAFRFLENLRDRDLSHPLQAGFSKGFDQKRTHIIFGANSRKFTGESIQELVTALLKRFVSPEKFRRNEEQDKIIVLLRGRDDDTLLQSVAMQSAIDCKKNGMLTIVPIIEQLSDETYQMLQEASTFLVTAGDNALMEAFSLGVWPFHIYHHLLAKKRDTLFPVSPHDIQKMTQDGIDKGFDPKVCTQALAALGTTQLPTDIQSHFFSQVVCPYVRVEYDYSNMVAMFHRQAVEVHRKNLLLGYALALEAEFDAMEEKRKTTQ
jgi:hypothetical protein